jgi:hypothetical protein
LTQWCHGLPPWFGVKQTQKGSLHDQVMGNEGVAGTVEKQLQMVRRVSCREAVSSIQMINANSM